MSLCVVAGGKVLTLAVSLFSLTWTHSVQKTQWREDWAVTPAGLELRHAYVKGSGAGMEPGDGAVLKDGWWQWQPQLPALPTLRLAASGMTPDAWTLCHAGGCVDLGAKAGDDAVLRPCGE
ncbi:DUF1850 domain-containing protein [Agrobacterium sp. a22-2]|uniref:DUF1850 domain-containing protein n=1 Tax=Agrobacterium sp. a22-2 TaxID=2283840 RepID=UPI0014456CF9|nr:DUF1850 domain-containing protein [Agrobacterium sp. a22-2]